MKYTTVPCFWVGDLENALEAQYGPEFIQEIRAKHNGIRRLMFDDFYMNDVCCKYYIDEMEEYEGHSWQNEAHIRNSRHGNFSSPQIGMQRIDELHLHKNQIFYHPPHIYACRKVLLPLIFHSPPNHCQVLFLIL